MPEFLKEWGVLVIATAALMQPWVMSLWRRFFRSGSINIYETGVIEIGYGESGATIGLHGTLRAIDRDLFIRSVHLELVKERDESRHEFEWAAFRSPRIVAGRQPEVTLKLPAGFLLLTSQPHRFNTVFYDATLMQEEIRPILEEVRKSWLERWQKGSPSAEKETLASTIVQHEATITFGEFSKDPRFTEAYTKLDRRCYWEPGQYELTLIVNTSRPDRTFERTWEFELSEADAENLHTNTVAALKQTCGFTDLQYFFAYVPYSAPIPELD